MIQEVLSHIMEKLEEFLKGNYDVSERLVSLGSPAEEAGHDRNNQLVLTLLNIEKEGATGTGPVYIAGSSSHMVAQRRSPWGLNVYFMVSVLAEKEQYIKSLRLLSDSLVFFQLYNSFELPSGKKFTVEPVSLNIQELSNVWSILGGKYYPSMAYKLRMLMVDGNEIGRITGKVIQTG